MFEASSIAMGCHYENDPWHLKMHQAREERSQVHNKTKRHLKHLTLRNKASSRAKAMWSGFQCYGECMLSPIWCPLPLPSLSQSSGGWVGSGRTEEMARRGTSTSKERTISRVVGNISQGYFTGFSAGDRITGERSRTATVKQRQQTLSKHINCRNDAIQIFTQVL